MTAVVLRGYQREAVNEIISAFRGGAENVVLSAPTGSGKTFIATTVARELGVTGLYGAASLALQDQYLRDFPEVPVIQGHINYCRDPDEHTGSRDLTCPMGCMYYDKAIGDHVLLTFSLFGLTVHAYEKHGSTSILVDPCEYAIRKMAARNSRLTNANPWYLFREWNGPAWFSGRGLLVVDEADALDGIVDSIYAQGISKRRLRKWGWEEPMKHATRTSVVDGLRRAQHAAYAHVEALDAKLLANEKRPELTGRQVVNLTSERNASLDDSTDIGLLAEQVALESAVAEWTKTEDDMFLVLPVRVGDALAEHAWPHARRRLFMSGSIVNGPAWASWVGLNPSTTAHITVPNMFPAANRPIQIWHGGPVMSSGGYDDTERVERVVDAIRAYRDGRTVVHVMSETQVRVLASYFPDAITYGNGASKQHALAEYAARPDGLLIGQSLWRGVDLKDDLCRTNIIAKVPWLPLSRTVRNRKTADGGYYIRSAMQEIIQALGRGVRGPDDWCRNYIVDGNFSGLERNFPQYMKDALV